jgi:hypothetical protein
VIGADGLTFFARKGLRHDESKKKRKRKEKEKVSGTVS